MAQAVEKYFEHGSMPSSIRVQKTQDKQSKEKEEFQRHLQQREMVQSPDFAVLQQSKLYEEKKNNAF